MKINKYLPIAICATALIPIAGLLFHYCQYAKMVKTESLFTDFFFSIFLPY